jgi:hypothetical protein
MFYRITVLALLLFIPVNSLPDKSSIKIKESANLLDGKHLSQLADLKPVWEKTFDEVKIKSPGIKGDIDLLKINHIAPKGRIQDREYNFQNQEMVEKLIKQGTASIPFLITKLRDETKLPAHTIDYWPDVTVADVAMLILTDLFTDSSWQKTTIPEANLSNMIGYNEQSGTSFAEWRTLFIKRYGRKAIKNKWERTWKKYQNRIYWDEKERCFNIK